MSPLPHVPTVRRYSWWLADSRYLRYMARELTSLFIGAYVGVLVIGLARLAEGRAAYETYLEVLQGAVSVGFHVLAFLFALYHSATWFNVTPKAMPLELGGQRVPGGIIIGAHYAGWVVVSVALLVLAGG